MYSRNQALSQRGLQSLQQATSRHLDRVVSFNPPTDVGYYQGWDAVKGKHRIKLMDGSMLYCNPASNGAPAKGEKVAVYVADGAVPYYDIMPG